MYELFGSYKNFPKNAGIYRITTKHNNLSYIGSAISLKKRMKDHRNELKNDDSHVKYMQNVFNIHGESDFQVEFLLICDKPYILNSQDHIGLVVIEEEFIQRLEPRYNTIKTPTTQRNNPGTSKKVYQYDLEGQFIKEWPSSREVMRSLDIQPQNGLRGKSRSSGGFQWSYDKVENLGKYRHLSGDCKKIKISWDKKSMEFESIKDCCEYFGGSKKIYQNLSYALKVGKLFKNKYKIEKL